MSDADIIAAEVFAWERYASHVGSALRGLASTHVFCGDEASHGLYRDWREARVARDALTPKWVHH